MSEKTKSNLSYIINDNIEKINNPDNQKQLLENPLILLEHKNNYINEIDKLLLILKKQYNEILPYIKKLKNNVESITEQTVINSSYLILSSILSTFESIFVLSKLGKYSQVMILLRNIEEAILQCNLFSIEYTKNENKNLNDWFRGEIISHSDGRKKFAEIMKGQNFDINSLQSYIYRMTSQYAHNGYISILEGISPYTKDLDYEGIMGFYRTIRILKSASTSMDNLIIMTKGIYLLINNDFNTYDEIDLILLKYNPSLSQINISENIKNMFPNK